MKTQMEPTREPIAADSLKASRFQIYRQTRAGNYVPGGHSDSASEAIETFLATTPIFEGGDLRIWDRREQKLVASVAWGREETDFGFVVRHRTNLFHDRLFGLVARQIQNREAIRHEMQRSAGMTV
jgi:hypothetical protein